MKRQKELLILAISIFLTLVAWVVIEVYRTQTSDKVTRLIAPLKNQNVTIDESVFPILKGKIDEK